MAELTDVKVKAAKPQDKAYKLTDGDGLYLYVTPTGGKLWRLKYRFKCKEKTLSIGKYPVVTLSNARGAMLDAKRALLDGVDPSAKKKASKVAEIKLVTFKDVAMELIEQKRLHCTENYVKGFLRSLELHLFPALGNRPIAEIGSMEVMETCKVAARSGSYIPHKLAQRAGEVFDLAVLTQRREYNPVNKATHKALPRHKTHSFAAITAEQLPEFFADLREYRGFPITKLMIEFILHTFLRTIEVRRVEWPMIDFTKRIIEIPGGSELNRKNAPLVPISDQVMVILEKTKAIVGDSKYVFPMFRDYSKMASENVITSALRNMGWKGDMTGHGCRALARTTLQEVGGFHEDVIELQLGHSVARNDTEGAYKRVKYLDERIRLMQYWSDYLDKAKN